MLITKLHHSHYHRVKFIFIASIITIVLLGCSKSKVESPNNTTNIWGFGNTVKNESNTFQENTASIADQTGYTFINQIDFVNQVNESLNTQTNDIYDMSFQQAALAQIVSQQAAKTYSIDRPLMIHNPYGTNSLSLYIYLGLQNQPIKIYYTISAEDESIPDFSDTMYINKVNTQVIEGQIIGLVSGQRNKIVLDIRDDSGNKIGKKAYILDIPDKTSDTVSRLLVEPDMNVEYTRGLFTYIVMQPDSGYYVFYDNNGILRSEIPTNVNQPNARILQVDNKIFYEYKDNAFALLNNLGGVIQKYYFEQGNNIIDYDYDSIQNRVIAIVEDSSSHNRDCITSLDIASGEWKELIDFKKLFPDYATFLDPSVEGSDWIDLDYIFAVSGKDMIILSRSLNSVFRINNIDSYPVIRWIISNEAQWSGTEYESLLLAKSSNKIDLGTIYSLSYSTSKKLSDAQLYLSFINKNSNHQNNVMEFSKYRVDENQNKYRLQQTVTFHSNDINCSAIGYGSHIIIGHWTEQSVIEYNEKGEIMLRITLPTMNSSYRIYKYTMDRYWF